MKIIIRTAIFHLLCIIVFSNIYMYLSDDFETSFETKKQNYKTFLDYFLLSTTIQAGIGLSDLYPTSYYSKIAVIVQQYIMMLTHIITLYVFTL